MSLSSCCTAEESERTLPDYPYLSLDFPGFPRISELDGPLSPVHVSDDGSVVLMPTRYWLEIVSYAIRLADVEDIYYIWRNMQDEAFTKNGWK